MCVSGKEIAISPNTMDKFNYFDQLFTSTEFLDESRLSQLFPKKFNTSENIELRVSH